MRRLYHNPRCSKSRAALSLLEESGLDFTVTKYLDDPPSDAMLRALIEKLGLPAAALLRRNEPAFKTLGLHRHEDIDEEEAIEALLTQPKLLQRPILETTDRAVIGRPPEKIRELLD